MSYASLASFCSAVSASYVLQLDLPAWEPLRQVQTS